MKTMIMKQLGHEQEQLVKSNRRKLLKMEESDSALNKWEEMQTDVLVKVFQRFTVFELVSRVSRVCRSWRLACSDPILWRTLDLGHWNSHFIKIPSSPYIWVADKSNKELTRMLRAAMILSHGRITCMIFHYNLYLTDEHLLHVAEWSRHLKRLVLPAWNLITRDAMINAIRKWGLLESLTMPSVQTPCYVMEQIGKNCKNFSELKIMGPCDAKFVRAIAMYVPNLKVLSLRCSKLQKEDLLMILDNLKHLQVLNISHCLLVEAAAPPAHFKVVRKLDMTTLAKASRLRSFLYCMKDACILCQRVSSDEGIMRWYNYEERLWASDEVMSLSY